MSSFVGIISMIWKTSFKPNFSKSFWLEKKGPNWQGYRERESKLYVAYCSSHAVYVNGVFGWANLINNLRNTTVT